MSIIRSIDRSDLGGATVTATTTTETLVLAGPMLQTPKDVSMVVALATVVVQTGTACAQVTARIRQGSTTSGTQVGGNYIQNTSGGVYLPLTIMVSAASTSTDYVQWCVTLQQAAATGNATVSSASMLMISF